MLFGRYEQAVRLGAGAMGEVYKAWDPAVGRWVALKFLKGSSAELLARFQREAQAAARLDHPNIARVYEAGEIDGRPYIAMEYVDGRTLGGRVEAAEAARLLRDAARGVQAAHEAGVIHRDLKPGNIMVGKDGRVRVMDFGLARPIEEGSTLTKSGLMVGTPSYMSPEQARGEVHATDARSDVYGLGATLYELLAGRAPYGGASIFDVVLQVASDDPVPPPAGVRAPLAAIAMKCLEKRPANRYASAGEVADELDRFLRGEAVRAKPMGRVPRRLALAAVGAVAVALLAAVVWRLKRTEAPVVPTSDLARSADVILQSALDLRRAGNVRGMKQKADELEKLCARVIERTPAGAEPHYQLGRMHRARFRYDEAAAAQERALTLDPAHGGARAEHAVLMLRAYRLRMERLQNDLVLQRSMQSMGARGLRVGQAPEDEEAVRLRTACERDLDALGPSASPILRAVLSRAPEVPAVVERLIQGRTLSDDEIVWVAWVERSSGEFARAVERYGEGLAKDRGYIPYLVGRAEARLAMARLSGLERDPSADYEAVVRDLDEAETLDETADVRGSRAVARIDWAFDRSQRGGDPFPLFEATHADLLKAPQDNATVAKLQGQLLIAWGHESAARGLDAASKYGAAADALGRAIAADRRLASAWFLRAQARTELGRLAPDGGEGHFRDALADAAEATRLAALTSEAWMSKAFIEAEYGQRIRDAGRMRAAIADLTECLRLTPKEPAALMMRGVTQAQLATFAGVAAAEAEALYVAAMEDLDLAVKEAPRGYEGWMRRAQVLASWGTHRVKRGQPPGPRFDQALKSARRAVELGPGRADAPFALGIVLFEVVRHIGEAQGEAFVREAEQAFTEALKRKPSSGDSHRLRGQARLALATQAKARQEASLALYDGAIADFTAALEADSGSRTARFLRGRARHESVPPRIQAGKPVLPVLRDAVADLEAVTPEDADGRYHLASARGTLVSVMAQLHEPADEVTEADAKALAAWEKALSMLPERAEAWFRRGTVHFVMRRWNEAGRDFEKALELDANHATARSLLEQCRKHP